MKGKHRVIVQNKRMREYYENGISSAVELWCDKECTVLEGRTWSAQLSMMQDSIVFIDEGNNFVMSDAFAAIIQNTDNYYVIVTREGIPSLPYSVDEIYGIRNSGKYGTLKQTYNEFYHLYQISNDSLPVHPTHVITEDSNSGYQFSKGCVTREKISSASVHRGNQISFLW